MGSTNANVTVSVDESRERRIQTVASPIRFPTTKKLKRRLNENGDDCDDDEYELWQKVHAANIHVRPASLGDRLAGNLRQLRRHVH